MPLPSGILKKDLPGSWFKNKEAVEWFGLPEKNI